MKIKTYQEAAKRTAKDLGPMLNVCHMALGMASELSELVECFRDGDNSGDLDKVHLVEELGDKMWYAVNYATFRGINIPEDIFEQPFTADMHLIINGGKIADYAKRWLAYGQEIKDQKTADQEEQVLLDYIRDINNTAKHYGLDIEIIMGINITKLYVRYPNNFSSDQALVRDLEIERAVLEGRIL